MVFGVEVVGDAVRFAVDGLDSADKIVSWVVDVVAVDEVGCECYEESEDDCAGNF